MEVQQDGVRETGVSVAYTVRKMDAGPIITCEKVEIDDQIKVCTITFLTLGLQIYY